MKNRINLSIIVLSVLLGLAIGLKGQTEQKQRLLLLGTSSGGLLLRANPPVTPEPYRFNHINFQPRIGFFVTDELLLAGQGMLAWTWATDQPLDFYHGWGALARYYPTWAHQAIRTWTSEKLETLFDIKPFLEIGYHQASYFANEQNAQGPGSGALVINQPTIIATPSIDELQFAAGLDWCIYRSIHLEVSLVYVYRPDGNYPAPATLQPRLGIDFLINKKKI